MQGGPSYTGTLNSALVVTEVIEGAHPKHSYYPLLPGDMMIQEANGTWHKFGPGLGISGFVLSDKQVATLELREDIHFGVGGMGWFLS